MIVITGTRAQKGVDGVGHPGFDQGQGPRHAGVHRASRVPGQTMLNTINYIPGVNFTQNDPYGSSGGNAPIRGFDGNRVSVTFDGVPLNDSGNYAIFSNQLLDPELVEQVNVNLGATDVDSPTASAAGGTVNFRSLIPTDELGVPVDGSLGYIRFQAHLRHDRDRRIHAVRAPRRGSPPAATPTTLARRRQNRQVAGQRQSTSRSAPMATSSRSRVTTTRTATTITTTRT